MHKSIDLFAGIGGIRRGFDNAFKDDIGKTAEKRKQGVGNDKSSDL